MAHKMSIKPVPHKNKDGSFSATKKDYEVWDRSRGKKTRVGVVASRKAADDLISAARKMLAGNHLRAHPNDEAFKHKHGIRSQHV